MQAVLNGHTEAIKILLHCFADVNVQDHEGNTALHHALNKNQKHIARMIMERGPEYCVKNNVCIYFYS